MAIFHRRGFVSSIIGWVSGIIGIVTALKQGATTAACPMPPERQPSPPRPNCGNLTQQTISTYEIGDGDVFLVEQKEVLVPTKPIEIVVTRRRANDTQQ